MTMIALFHSVLGVRPGPLSAAEMLRSHVLAFLEDPTASWS